MYPGAPPPTPENYPSPPRPPRPDVSIFAKLLIGFAALGCLSFGLCGVALVTNSGNHARMGSTLVGLSLGGMAVGFLGVVVTGFVWVIVLVVNSSRR